MTKREDYDHFFRKIEEIKEENNKQKQRGLNDYNLLTTVLEPHDEVRLHSRVIGSLLNPNGLHYQNTLFLEKFLGELKLDNFNMELNKISVEVEYQNIDLLVTDGLKHIIIENKIWAGDQPCQIIKYINIIKEKYNLNLDEKEDIPKIENIRVIYLTLRNKDIPDEHSVCDDGYIYFSGSDDRLDECSKRDKTKELVPDGLKNYKVLFKKIGYKQEILDWLYKCQDEIQNITNLNEAIRQYIDVVKTILQVYDGKIKSLEKRLIEELKRDKHLVEFLENYTLYKCENNQSICEEIDRAKNNFKSIFYKWLSKETNAYVIDFNDKNYLNVKVHGINLHFTNRENGILLCNTLPNNAEIEKKTMEKVNKILKDFLGAPKNRTEYSIDKITLSKSHVLFEKCKEIISRIENSL